VAISTSIYLPSSEGIKLTIVPGSQPFNNYPLGLTGSTLPSTPLKTGILIY
jgi:hypothetical protein